MNIRIEAIKKEIQPLCDQILNHNLYASIKTIEDLRVFMKYHVYAVWDFMSLLKSLQNNLTCTTIPWYPVGSPDTRFLINEIVVGEESDVDMNNVRKSHFEIYIDAMNQVDADHNGILQFIDQLKKGSDFTTAYASSNVPDAARQFVDQTFSIINSGEVHSMAAAFTFGREDLIPGMFMSMVNDLHDHNPNTISIFKYYLERHIEVDGDHHSHLAIAMTEQLCGEDDAKWKAATEASVAALKSRISLWDAALNEILN
ncbi:MAG: hypothetical protein RL582_1555 [Bacteroidota bacterium]|jgi:hypothetical protein